MYNVTENSTTWELLDLEIRLKDKNKSKESLSNAFEILSNAFLQSELDWFFFIKNSRRCVKKVDKNDMSELGKVSVLIDKLGQQLNENIDQIGNTEHILKLLMSCEEGGLVVKEKFHSFLEDLYSRYKKCIEIELNEFIFIDCELRRRSENQRVLRYLILLDPMEGMKRTCFGVDDKYWFVLMSFNDSELIRFMKTLFDQSIGRFFEFYSFIIGKELISVDFLVDQLLTDSPALLELLLAIFGTEPDLIGRKLRAHFKNFHVLLSLKVNLFAAKFPFNCGGLQKKLDNFIARIK